MAQKFEISFLHIFNINLTHIGNYKCYVNFKEELDFAKADYSVLLPPRIVAISRPVRIKLHKNVQLHCLASGYPLVKLNWFKGSELIDNEHYNIQRLNETLINSTLKISEVTKKDNGTYHCRLETVNSSSTGHTDILVLGKPQVYINFVKALGKSEIYLNWTLNDGNEPKNLRYSIQYMASGGSNWIYYQKEINSSVVSQVLHNFTANTSYTLRLQAQNSEGESQPSVSAPVQMLAEDPVFVPEVKVTGVSISSITISWTDPASELDDFVQYYQLRLFQDNSTDLSETVSQASSKNLYMFSNLKAATTYNFQVQACCEYNKKCSPWSEKVNGTTMDGVSGPVTNVSIDCRFENISHTNYVFVTWKPPLKPHGKVMSYNVNLEGNACFLNENGDVENITWGPKVTSINENILSARFYNVSANTNYTIRVSAVTRSKKNGEKVELFCTMPPTIPDKQKLSRFTWSKMEDQGRWMFKLNMPRITERNGPICCYRVYLVRMESQQKLGELPEPDKLEIVSYRQAHRTSKGGTYVAEMFTRYLISL